jgi:hypothetical protein
LSEPPLQTAALCRKRSGGKKDEEREEAIRPAQLLVKRFLLCFGCIPKSKTVFPIRQQHIIYYCMSSDESPVSQLVIQNTRSRYQERRKKKTKKRRGVKKSYAALSFFKQSNETLKLKEALGFPF